MANNIVVQYTLGINTVLNGTIALRIQDESGRYSYWVPEEDVVEHTIGGNLIGYLSREKIDSNDNTKRFIDNYPGRKNVLDINKVKRIRTDHRDGGFKYWVRYTHEGSDE